MKKQEVKQQFSKKDRKTLKRMEKLVARVEAQVTKLLEISKRLQTKSTKHAIQKVESKAA